MPFDYAKHYPAIGQKTKLTCWAASVSWWLQYMALGLAKRKWLDQEQLIERFRGVAEADGSMSPEGIRRVGADAEIRMTIDYLSPTQVLDDCAFEAPTLVIYNFPQVGGTHMNVVFNRDFGNDTVQCMEPFYPFPGTDGARTGTFVTRAMSHFTGSETVGIGYATFIKRGR